MWSNSGLWSTLLRKTAIGTTFDLAAEKESVWIRRKLVGVNRTGHNLDVRVLQHL